MAYDDDLVPYPEIPPRRGEDPLWYRGPRRVWIQPGATPPTGERPRTDVGPYRDEYHFQQGPPPAEQSEMPTTSAAPRGVPPPRAESTVLPRIPGEEQQLREREAFLYGKLNKPPATTTLGRVGRTLGTIGQDVATGIAPEVMGTIPGTTLNRRLELADVRRQLGEYATRDIAQQRVDIERQAAGLPTRVPGEEYTKFDSRTNEPIAATYEYKGRGHALVPIGVSPPNSWEEAVQAGYAEPGGMPVTPAAPRAAAQPGTLPTIPPEITPGIPRQVTEAPPTGAMPPVPQPAAAQVPAAARFGKVPAAQLPLKKEEIDQQNAANQEYWRRLEPIKPFPQTLTLGPNSTPNDAARIDAVLKNMESAGGLQESRRFNQELARDREQRQKESEQLRQQAADEKMVHAVDNNNRVHFTSQGDYNTHAGDFHPHPFTLPPGEYDKAVQSATRVNEMQARMNDAAMTARAFNWRDSGQVSIVTQLMNQLNEPSWVGRTLGIDPLGWLQQNFLTRPGAEGATPETRNYVISLLSLREAMLALPKEITEGSRMTEQGVGALYATLPQGWTPNYAWAIGQLRATQAILDRDRGTKVPIIDGMREERKSPLLYRFAATDPKTKEQIYSDDQAQWFDENGDPYRKR